MAARTQCGWSGALKSSEKEFRILERGKKEVELASWVKLRKTGEWQNKKEKIGFSTEKKKAKRTKKGLKKLSKARS